MKLINQSKTTILTSKGSFKINSIVDFEESEARTLLKYGGISAIESLEDDGSKSKTEMQLLKEEATELGVEFAGNVSKATLKELIETAKAGE